jgi:hypothetical protein
MEFVMLGICKSAR